MANIIISTSQVKDYKEALIEAVSSLNQDQALLFRNALMALLPIASQSEAEEGIGTGLMNAVRTLQAIEANAATKYQGELADSAVQHDQLGSAAFQNTENFATAEQGNKADNAAKAIDMSVVAYSGDYSDLTNKPVFGTAAFENTENFATAVQGSKADQAIPLNKIGVPNGVVPLDSATKIDPVFLPADGSFQGTWNANTNTPTITSGSGIQNSFYVVSVSGSTTIDGINTWSVGDQIRFNGEVWQRIPSVQAVNSVNNKLGAVQLNVEDIPGAMPSSSYTAADVLAKIKTVDGSGSGLDAELLNGQAHTYYLNFNNFSGTIKLEQLPTDITVSGTSSSNKIRISGTDDASLTSTTHPFQIGPTSGANLIIDNNEIMARNNGGTATLSLNSDGGALAIGSSSSTTSISGSLLVEGFPATTHYPGSSKDITDYPIGTSLLTSFDFVVDGSSVFPNRNAQVYVYNLSGNDTLYATVKSAKSGVGTLLTGTWRAKGSVQIASGSFGWGLVFVQRTA